MSRQDRGSSLDDISNATSSVYSRMFGMQSKIGLDIKRNHYRRMPNTSGNSDLMDVDLLTSTSQNSDDDPDKATVAQTYFTFFKSFIGIGVLALPYGYLLAGSVLGLFMILIASYTSWYCITLLLEARDTVERQIHIGTVNSNVLPAGVSQLTPTTDDPDAAAITSATTTNNNNTDNSEQEFPKMNESSKTNSSHHATETSLYTTEISYSDIGRAAFGSKGAKIVDFAIVTAQMGFATAYLIFIGSNVEAALGTCIGSSSWATIAALLVCPLVWMRSLKKLSFGAVLADCAIVFGLIVIFVYAFINASDKNRPKQEPAVALGTSPFIFFGMAVFAFEGAGIVLPMKQSMANPMKFKNVLRNGIVSITILYTIFPLVVYLCYGSVTKDMVTSNLPKNNFIVVLVELSYSIGLYFTYPIQMWPAIQILEGSRLYRSFTKFFNTSIKSFDNDEWNELIPSMIFRTLLVIVTLICATAIPKFGTFVAIIGSISCSLIAYILPTLFSLILHPNATRNEKWIKYGMCAFGVIGGFISFVIEIIELFQSKGIVDDNTLRCWVNESVATTPSVSS